MVLLGVAGRVSAGGPGWLGTSPSPTAGALVRNTSEVMLGPV